MVARIIQSLGHTFTNVMNTSTVSQTLTNAQIVVARQTMVLIDASRLPLIGVLNVTPMDKVQEQIAEILAGIDKTECESDNGWWETSTGAEFGIRKLVEIKQFLEAMQARIELLEKEKEALIEVLHQNGISVDLTALKEQT